MELLIQGSRKNLHLIERYTRPGSDLITYRITVDDPTTFARQWTEEIPLTRQNGANMMMKRGATRATTVSPAFSRARARRTGKRPQDGHAKLRRSR